MNKFKPKTNAPLAAGFTLAELLVVVVILAIAALVVVPIIGDSNDLKIAAAARSLASDLLYAQTCAIANQRQYQVLFDSGANTYEIQDHDGTVITNPVSKAQYIVDFPNDANLKTVAIDSALFDGQNKLWFDRLGAPYSGNIVDNTPLADGAITLSAPGHTANITIVPITGRINVN